MSTEKGNNPLERDESGAGLSSVHSSMPKDWRSALATLLFARLEIIRIEAKAASAVAAGRLALLLVALFGIFSAWTLSLAAAIGAIAASSSWKWYHVALAAAGLHGIIALVFLLLLKSGKKIDFPVTRAEFEKDREWLEGRKKQ